MRCFSLTTTTRATEILLRSFSPFVVLLLLLCANTDAVEADLSTADTAATTTRVISDKDVLLAWKGTLPQGDCLGCQDGPVFMNWTADTDVCDWTSVVDGVAGESYPVERGVTRCSKSKKIVHKL